MAIFNKIECKVTIDGKHTPEYDGPRDEDAAPVFHNPSASQVVEKYIESQPDQNFAINIAVSKDFNFRQQNALILHVYIDGTKMEGRIFKKKEVRKMQHIRETVIDGVRRNTNAGGVLHKFRFSALTTDEAAKPRSEVDVKQFARIGDIVIKVYRGSHTGRSKKAAREGDERVSPQKVSEKHTKGRAIDTFTSLDTSKPGRILTTCKVKLEAEPLVEFVFHYRGREVLQQLGILETPLTERPLEERDPSTLTLEEMRELLRRKEEVIRQQEDTEKFMKKRLREADAQRNLFALEALKRPRTMSPIHGGDDNDDEEVQVVKRAKKDRKIEIVELD